LKKVRRRFWEIKDILSGAAGLNYGKCIDISSIKAAQRKIILPASLAIITPHLPSIPWVDQS
jgi:Na+/H+-translocating membrane pyrophosphatase